MPAANARFHSLLQVKTPPDLQDRAFAVERQLALIGSTTPFLLTGALVDHLLAPPASVGNRLARLHSATGSPLKRRRATRS